MKNFNFIIWSLILGLCIMLFSITDRQTVLEADALLYFQDMMPRAEVTPVSPLNMDNSCDDDFLFSRNNRPVGRLSSYISVTGETAQRFHAANIIPSQYLREGVTTIQDILMNGWYDRRYVYKEGTVKALGEYMDKIDMASLIRLDKFHGGPPWQEMVIRRYLEDDHGFSLAAEHAHNHWGIKCDEHSIEWHKAQVIAARKKGIGRLLNINSSQDTTCYWGGGDHSPSEGANGPYVHYKYFSTAAEGDAMQADILTKKRYAWYINLPFNYEITKLKIKTIKGKKTNYLGHILEDGKEYALTNADWHFVGADVSYYASDPMYATKRSMIYWAYFGDWTEDDFIFYENSLVPELGENLNRNEQYADNS